ncbi:unnamed protein product, partial [Didymodactylos carnosus]
TEFQKEFVTLWVPKYEHMLKELLSVAAAAKEDEDLQLNAIKYETIWISRRRQNEQKKCG